MTMQLVNLIQGTPAWHQHRREHFNASDAPAMMGVSSYKTRSELIKELATGIAPDVDAATQRRFDDGHKFEAMARPLAEEIIGEDLSPCVGTEGKLSASFDGLTFMNDVGFEHKSLNQTLRDAFADIDTVAPEHRDAQAGRLLPLQYQVQMEQQAAVAGCDRILFMATKWAPDGTLLEKQHCWYTPNLDLRAQIVAGWEQLEKEVEAFDTSAPQAQPVTAEPVESLPAVAVQLQGSLAVVSNLDKFGDALRGFIGRMVAKPSTDQEFADAEAECKALKKAEEMLEAAESSALAQISDVELLRRTVADLRNLARTTRLTREKVVAAEKDARRTALVLGAQQDLDAHVAAQNQRLGANWLPRMAGGFAEVIKGKKSLTNMQDAVAVALTNAKAECNTLAHRLDTNRQHLVQGDTDWIALFADFATVGTKAAEDFQALAALRIGQHKQAEADRLEKERERIRAEEEAKARREAEARAAAEAAEQVRQLEAERERIRAEEQEKVQAELARQRQQVQQQAQAAQADIAQAAQDGSLAKPLAVDLTGLAVEKATEGLASIDAQQAISAAKASAATAEAEDEPMLTLGQVNTKLKDAGLGQISAATLEHHGIPFTKERAAVQIKTTQVRRLMLLISMGTRKFADELQVAATV